MSYIASTSQPSYWGPSASVSGTAPPCLPSTSLNFLATLASTDLEHHNHAAHGLMRLELRSAGTGGHAIVEIGRTAYGELVAVKRSKILSQPFGMQDEDAFDKHFNQLLLELRILSHRRLRKHPNIVNLIGLLMDEHSDRPSLSLILEHSAFGTIASFLDDRPEMLSVIERVDLILQIAKGLEALHELKICHGDVKTQNTLVFQNGEKWTVKLSDFGQSVVAAQDDSATSPVRCPLGTRLLNAPEIRNGVVMNNVLFNIGAALLTDIFSFGLLAWEVLKNGKTFIEASWVEDCGNDPDVESIEDFLNSLPMNGVRSRGLEFLEKMGLEKQVEKRLSMVFEGALHDNPAQRRPISCLSKMLDLSLEIEE